MRTQQEAAIASQTGPAGQAPWPHRRRQILGLPVRTDHEEPHSGHDFSSTAFALAQRKHSAKPVSCLSTPQHNANLLDMQTSYPQSRQAIGPAAAFPRPQPQSGSGPTPLLGPSSSRRNQPLGSTRRRSRASLDPIQSPPSNRLSALQSRQLGSQNAGFLAVGGSASRDGSIGSLAGIGLGPIWERIVIWKRQPNVRWLCKPYSAEFDQWPSTMGVFLWTSRLQVHGYQQFRG